MPTNNIWNEIENLGWGKDHDFYRIARELSTNPQLRDALIKFTDERREELIKRIVQVLYSDQMNDVLWDIVGSGKEAFDEAMANPALIFERVNSGDFNDSFGFFCLPFAELEECLIGLKSALPSNYL